MDNNNGGACIEMPKYECHKTVHALKIREVTEVPSGGALIVPEDARYAALDVEADWVQKYSPEAGGYYVVYEDGYKSYSPATAFENGYTRVK
jgi:hypothetical protein